MLQQLAQSGGSQMLQGGMFPPGISIPQNPNSGTSQNSQNPQMPQMSNNLQSINPMGQSGNAGMAEYIRQQQIMQ